jgi:hypothetical protein
MEVWEDKLVVFGRRNILVYDSADVVSTLVLHDVIEGVGCIARDSVQAVGTDILFLSSTGVRSLKKSLITTKAPLQDISNNVRDDLVQYASTGTASKIRSVYNPIEGFYLLIIPSSTAPIIYCFDVKNLHHYNELPTEDMIRVSKWTGFGSCTSVYMGCDGVMYMGVRNSAGNGVIASYAGYDDGGEPYTLKYKSPWMDLSSEEQAGTFYKIPKKATLTTVGGGTYNPTFTWAFDWSMSENTNTQSVSSPTGASEWGLAEWGVDEWNASARELVNSKFQLSKYGQHMRIGVTIPIDGKEISIQKIDLFMKRGRISH